MWVYQKPESSEPLEPLSAPSVPDSTLLKTNVTLPEPNDPFPAEGHRKRSRPFRSRWKRPGNALCEPITAASCWRVRICSGPFLRVLYLLCAAPASWKRSTIISAAGGLPLQRKRRLRQWAFSGRNF